MEEYSGDTKTYDQKSNTTETYSNNSRDHFPTKGYDESEGSPKMDRSDIHGLCIGDDIVLNDKNYKIVDIISGDNITGEAVIYKIIDPAKKKFSLKLYYKFSNPKDEPNPESLQRIKTITDPNILKLYDYGTHEKKYLQKYCFEICEFAKGSDLLSVLDILKKYTVNFIETHVIPQIFKGISTLQDHKIFHCDIKPQNIFFLDEEQTKLVIGDYGSAKTFDEASEKQSRRTSTSKGTDYYLAPEQARGMISEKNDYYSFGMVLLHLLYPESFNRTNFNKIIERQFSRKPIIDFQRESQRINDLIAGLTLVDVTARWSKNEVGAWLRHEKIKVDYNGGMGDSIQPIKLGNTNIYAAEDLIQYIENDSKWNVKLIEDIEGFNQLKRWVGDLQDIDKKTTFDTMVRTYQQDGEEFLKQSILRYFDPKRPIHMDMKTYNFRKREDICILARKYFLHLDDIWKISPIKKIKYQIFQLEFVLRQIQTEESDLKDDIQVLLDKMAVVLDDRSENKGFDNYLCTLYLKINDENLIKLFDLFDQERIFKDLNNIGFSTIDQVGKYFAANEEFFENPYLILEKKWFFKKNNFERLTELSYNDLLFEIFKEHHLPEIHFVSLTFENKKEITITGLCFNSLTQFFKKNNINKELTYGTSGKKFSFTFSKTTAKSKRKFVNRCLNKIKVEFLIKPEKIPKKVINSFYSEMKAAYKKEQALRTKQKAGALLRIALVGLFSAATFGFFRLYMGKQLEDRISSDDGLLIFLNLSAFQTFDPYVSLAAAIFFLTFLFICIVGLYFLSKNKKITKSDIHPTISPELDVKQKQNAGEITQKTVTNSEEPSSNKKKCPKCQKPMITDAFQKYLVCTRCGAKKQIGAVDRLSFRTRHFD